MEVVFLENKYTNWYFSIIRNANNKAGEYVEKHHIIPRCIGGSTQGKISRTFELIYSYHHAIDHSLLFRQLTYYNAGIDI